AQAPTSTSRPARRSARTPPSTPTQSTRSTPPAPSSRPSSPSRSQIREFRVALQEREPLDAGRSVAVLGEDDLGEALLVGLLVVVLVAVDEHNEVGVLLDRSGFSQVGEDRPLVVTLLDGAGKLRHRQDRHVEVAREHLQVARNL